MLLDPKEFLQDAGEGLRRIDDHHFHPVLLLSGQTKTTRLSQIMLREDGWFVIFMFRLPWAGPRA